MERSDFNGVVISQEGLVMLVGKQVKGLPETTEGILQAVKEGRAGNVYRVKYLLDLPWLAGFKKRYLTTRARYLAS